MNRTKNIVLVGYRCSGKTTVGKRLADRYRMSFVDTDDLIQEESGLPIGEIISRHGWNHFRAMERQVIRALSRQQDLVIATGGGAVMNEANVRDLKKNGFIIWLYADPGVLCQRMERDQATGKTRPPLKEADPVREIKQVLDLRRRYYEQASDLVVDTTELSPAQVIAWIGENLSKTLGA